MKLNLFVLEDLAFLFKLGQAQKFRLSRALRARAISHMSKRPRSRPAANATGRVM